MPSYPPSDRTTNLLIWAVLTTIAVGWQIVAMVSPRVEGAVVMVRLLRRSRLVRLGMVLGWMWIGWHLFVRTSIGS